MKIVVKGEPYEMVQPEDLTTVELRELKERTGMGLRSFMRAMEDMDGDAVVALAYFAEKRAGEKVKWSDFDTLKPFTDVDFPDAPAGEDEDGDEPDPSPDPATAPPDVGTTPTPES